MVLEEYRMMEDYEINIDTMVMTPYDYEGELFTLVHEVDLSFLVPMKPYQIIKLSCESFGESPDCESNGIKKATGYTRKAPVPVCKTLGIYFFPTISPTHHDCLWISPNHIKSIFRQPTEDHKTLIHFKNGLILPVDISQGSLKNQLSKTIITKDIFEKRVNESKTRSETKQSLRAAEQKGLYSVLPLQERLGLF